MPADAAGAGAVQTMEMTRLLEPPLLRPLSPPPAPPQPASQAPATLRSFGAMCLSPSGSSSSSGNVHQQSLPWASTSCVTWARVPGVIRASSTVCSLQRQAHVARGTTRGARHRGTWDGGGRLTVNQTKLAHPPPWPWIQRPASVLPCPACWPLMVHGALPPRPLTLPRPPAAAPPPFNCPTHPCRHRRRPGWARPTCAGG